jgi:23S rRNA (adenine2030-N6)-methyltransferase
MNYRHQFHAGNFADVMKHALILQLLRALQSKEKGILYLDTHAGRGSYDLAAALKGDSLARQPEWPDGIGRLWSQPDLPAALADYVERVKQFDHERGSGAEGPRFYPGSPWLARMLARPQDRLALCEKHPAEFQALSVEFQFSPRTAVQLMDGYVALRAMLPPPERRALILIDPAFEQQDEFEQVVQALDAALQRFPAGVFGIWYPLTERAGVDFFFAELRARHLPPTLVVELMIAGEQSAKKMRGCGLALINPPWKFAESAEPTMQTLARMLAQEGGGGFRIHWLVPER